MPYQGQQPYGMPDDLVIPGIMDLDNTDEKLWVCPLELLLNLCSILIRNQVPQAEDVWFRPLLFNTSNGSYLPLPHLHHSN